MSRSSDLSSEMVHRRVPTQARAERTVAGLLDAAGAVIAEVGYDAATLTAVAARAGASIGSLYQYFPDKPAVARALAQRYGAEIADRWAPLVAEAASLPVRKLVDRMFDIMLQFHADFPAFLSLVTAPVDYRHAKTDRSQLRDSVTALLRAHQPRLTRADAACVAEVTAQIFKAMNRSFSQQTEARRQAFAREFKLVLLGYLDRRLHA
jgi:AcrR family transcriptional regulator